MTLVVWHDCNWENATREAVDWAMSERGKRWKELAEAEVEFRERWGSQGLSEAEVNANVRFWRGWAGALRLRTAV